MSKAMRKRNSGTTVESWTIDDATMEKEMKKAKARLARPPVSVTFYLPPSLLEQLRVFTRSTRSQLGIRFSRDQALQSILARKLNIPVLDPLEGRLDSFDELKLVNEGLERDAEERHAREAAPWGTAPARGGGRN